MPALFEITVRFLTPFSASAAIRFSGTPQSPKPPARIDAPSFTSAIASRAFATTLFIAPPPLPSRSASLAHDLRDDAADHGIAQPHALAAPEDHRLEARLQHSLEAE